MTPPLMPMPSSIPSAATIPPSAPPAGASLIGDSGKLAQFRDRAYWTNVIHNVAKVTPDDPRYAASRIVRDQAIQGLQDLADSAGQKDVKDISPGPVGTALVNFGHGASLGLAGDPTYLQLSKEANPWTAGISDVAGTAALGGVLSPLVAGLTPATGGAVLGGALGAGRGAIEPIGGMSRSESAALMGLGGAVTGALVGKATAKLGSTVQTIWGNVAKLLGKTGTAQDVANVAEAAVRAELKRLQVQPDIAEQMITSWKTNGTLGTQGADGTVPRPVPTPPTVRPGETITPVDPLESPAYQRSGKPLPEPRPSPMAKGQPGAALPPPLPEAWQGTTLKPGGVGGHSYSGTYPASPSPQDVLAFLKSGSPQELLTKLTALHGMGIRELPGAMPDLLQRLLGGTH